MGYIWYGCQYASIYNTQQRYVHLESDGYMSMYNFPRIIVTSHSQLESIKHICLSPGSKKL